MKMRIKLNLMQLTLDKNPSTYWLHINLNNIFLIKQLKNKIQNVLKESRDIDLCLENVPFLDEDDIHAINENEEITVVVKKNNNCTESEYFEADTQKFDTSIDYRINSMTNDTSNISSNNILSTENIKSNLENDHESSVSSVVQTISKKRVRKRTHKKKKQVEQVESIENNIADIQFESSVTSFKNPSKMHKRFKLENKQDNEDDSSSSDESLRVQREVFRCNSSSQNVDKKDDAIQPIWKKKSPLKTKVTKVPVFVRGQTCTPKNSTENSSYTENGNVQNNDSNTSEDYDMLVIDWKNMNPVKISNISELQIYDLIQFKTLFMNECGEPGMSSVITARLEHIYKNTLHIQVLSGIKEFMMLNSKFNIDEENNGTQREVEFNDIFEVFKLI